MVSTFKKKWEIDDEALERLLRSLDKDRDIAGAKYERLRRKLVEFFVSNQCSDAENEADIVIDRVARRLSEGVEIESLPGYSYGVARMRLLEIARMRTSESAAFASDITRSAARGDDDDLMSEESELRLSCLRKCLLALPTETKQLVVSYYGEPSERKIKARKQLGERFGVGSATLRVRMHRIRTKLEICVRDCCGEKAMSETTNED